MTATWFDERSATFGDRLAAARDRSGLSAAQLAARIGVRAATLENWEADRSEPRANRAQMLAGLLNVSIVWLLTGEGEGGVDPAHDPDSGRAEHDAIAMARELREIRLATRGLLDRMAALEKRIAAQGRDA
jgi:transcriptional regulator with XRE-family HTH domain